MKKTNKRPTPPVRLTTSSTRPAQTKPRKEAKVSSSESDADEERNPPITENALHENISQSDQCKRLMIGGQCLKCGQVFSTDKSCIRHAKTHLSKRLRKAVDEKRCALRLTVIKNQIVKLNFANPILNPSSTHNNTVEVMDVVRQFQVRLLDVCPETMASYAINDAVTHISNGRFLGLLLSKIPLDLVYLDLLDRDAQSHPSNIKQQKLEMAINELSLIWFSLHLWAETDTHTDIMRAWKDEVDTLTTCQGNYLKNVHQLCVGIEAKGFIVPEQWKKQLFRLLRNLRKAKDPDALQIPKEAIGGESDSEDNDAAITKDTVEEPDADTKDQEWEQFTQSLHNIVGRGEEGNNRATLKDWLRAEAHCQANLQKFEHHCQWSLYQDKIALYKQKLIEAGVDEDATGVDQASKLPMPAPPDKTKKLFGRNQSSIRLDSALPPDVTEEQQQQLSDDTDPGNVVPASPAQAPPPQQQENDKAESGSGTEHPQWTVSEDVTIMVTDETEEGQASSSRPGRNAKQYREKLLKRRRTTLNASGLKYGLPELGQQPNKKKAVDVLLVNAKSNPQLQSHLEYLCQGSDDAESLDNSASSKPT